MPLPIDNATVCPMQVSYQPSYPKSIHPREKVGRMPLLQLVHLHVRLYLNLC